MGWDPIKAVKQLFPDDIHAVATGVANAFNAGPAHRRRLEQIDIRIVVSGVRGKSSVAKWLHDIFVLRGHDTLTKTTGTQARIYYNDTEYEIEREAQVRLYENERELNRFNNIDVAIVENQGIGPYTTRLVNTEFIRPHVVFLTNVREDHLDTLGGDLIQIARAFARSVSSSTTVICGEQYPPLQEYIEDELARRSASVRFIQPPPTEWNIVGYECVYGINAVLDAIDQPLVNSATLQRWQDTLRPSWRQLPSGRVYNAASVNDIQSTEQVRRSLLTDTDCMIEPLLNLRWDRRGRTASFIRYLEYLYECKAICQVHTLGDEQALVERNVSFSVHRHDTGVESPSEVLDSVLKTDRPVLLMGNVVTEFMQSLLEEIENRSKLTTDQTVDSDTDCGTE